MQNTRPILRIYFNKVHVMVFLWNKNTCRKLCGKQNICIKKEKHIAKNVPCLFSLQKYFNLKIVYYAFLSKYIKQ